MASSQELLLGTGTAVNAFQIQRSLRFNSADSAYLNRTPASASNRKTWTWSGWIKRSALTGNQALFSANGNTGTSDYFVLSFENTSNVLRCDGYWGGATRHLRDTVSVYRDVSAWYHIVLSVDTTQATDTNRILVYVNNVNYPFSTGVIGSWPAQNSDGGINSNILHEIGRRAVNNDYSLNGYLTNINFIDGQALTPSSFGETNADTGVWQPKAYSGTYGTNGFQLLFTDNSGTTSTTLGKDTSGNGNNWTPNNFSVTAGAGNDSLVDTPTPYGTDTGAGGEVRGNYCTLNPLNKDSSATLANGNLELTTPVSTYGLTYGTIGVSSGKWYWEVTPTSMSGAAEIGIGKAGISLTAAPGGSSLGYVYVSSALKGNGGYTSYGATYTTNDVIGIALDLDAGTLVFYKNNSSQGTAFSSLSGEFFAVIADSGAGAGSTFTVNFGQRPFAYTAPSGFKALCTQNLPTPTIGATSATQANDYFDVTLYTGNGTTNTITNSGMQPDFLWVKSRSVGGAGYDNIVFDAVRGASKSLATDITGSEYTGTDLTSFNSNGFTAAAPNQWYGVNSNGVSQVAWQWKANGAGSSNTQGTITSTVSANTTAGFSIVTWTANGTQTGSVGHGLGITPTFIIYKKRNGTSDWYVWITFLNGNQYLLLNSTITVASLGSTYGSPTSTTISNYGWANGDNMLAYCFAPVAGYSAFGSYTGNGNSDGPFVYTGFRPAYVMYKRTDVSDSWVIYDTKRNTYNVVNNQLYANTNGAEYAGTSSFYMDILSNGFKVRGTDPSMNANGGTYIYSAFAENPFKYSLAR